MDLFFHPLGNTRFTEFSGRSLHAIDSICLGYYTTINRGRALIGNEKPDFYDHVEIAVGESAIEQFVRLRIRDGDLGRHHLEKYHGLRTGANTLFSIFASLNGANISSIDWRKLLGTHNLIQFEQTYEKLPASRS